jgi:hypothetical protein
MEEIIKGDLTGAVVGVDDLTHNLAYNFSFLNKYACTQGVVVGGGVVVAVGVGLGWCGVDGGYWWLVCLVGGGGVWVGVCVVVLSYWLSVWLSVRVVGVLCGCVTGCVWGGPCLPAPGSTPPLFPAFLSVSLMSVYSFLVLSALCLSVLPGLLRSLGEAVNDDWG